jgi:hypothetical protein
VVIARRRKQQSVLPPTESPSPEASFLETSFLETSSLETPSLETPSLETPSLETPSLESTVPSLESLATNLYTRSYHTDPEDHKPMVHNTRPSIYLQYRCPACFGGIEYPKDGQYVLFVILFSITKSKT